MARKFNMFKNTYPIRYPDPPKNGEEYRQRLRYRSEDQRVMRSFAGCTAREHKYLVFFF